MECTDILVQEYFKIADIISAYDDRIMIIKGWGVTFSLVALGVAFQKRLPPLFLVSALSALCFCLLDATYKTYQTNYYPQMRNIEIVCSSEQAFSNTGIDWGWERANQGFEVNSKIQPKQRKPHKGPLYKRYSYVLRNWGVYLPYAFPFGAGIILFVWPGFKSLFLFVWSKFKSLLSKFKNWINDKLRNQTANASDD